MKLSIFLLALAILVAGCVQYGTQTTATPTTTTTPAAAGVKEFQMTIFHTGYSPSTLTVNKGDTVRILAITGSGTAAHNHGITIDEYGVNQAVTSESNPVKIEFTADKQGTFSIYCKTCQEGAFGAAHPDIRGILAVK